MDLPPFTQLAVFSSDTQNEYDSLLGATAIAYAKYGSGAVVTISTHPESTFLAPAERHDSSEATSSDGAHPVGNARCGRLVQRAVLLVTNPQIRVQ